MRMNPIKTTRSTACVDNTLVRCLSYSSRDNPAASTCLTARPKDLARSRIPASDLLLMTISTDADKCFCRMALTMASRLVPRVDPNIPIRIIVRATRAWHRRADVSNVRCQYPRDETTAPSQHKFPFRRFLQPRKWNQPLQHRLPFANPPHKFSHQPHAQTINTDAICFSRH